MDNTIDILGKLMDATTLRQKVLANNLANANTANYLRKDIEFSSKLAKAIDKGPEAVSKVTPEVIVDTDAETNEIGNSVSIQKEMSEMAQNELLYSFASEMTQHKFSSLRRAIKETK